MKTSSNGNIFRVTGPLCGEFTSHRWIPLTKTSDTELWYFLWSPLINGVNSREAGDLRWHRAHYNVTVMQKTYIALTRELFWCLCEYLRENWPCYNGIALYVVMLCGSTNLLICFVTLLWCMCVCHIKVKFVISLIYKVWHVTKSLLSPKPLPEPVLTYCQLDP